MSALKDADLDHVEVIVGGIVPDQEHASLMDAGVARIFGPGASRDEIVGSVSQLGAQVLNVKLSEGDFVQ